MDKARVGQTARKAEHTSTARRERLVVWKAWMLQFTISRQEASKTIQKNGALRKSTKKCEPKI